MIPSRNDPIRRLSVFVVLGACIAWPAFRVEAAPPPTTKPAGESVAAKMPASAPTTAPATTPAAASAVAAPASPADGSDEPTYRVIINAEEQYSIWPTERTVPPGWTDTGKSGAKVDCLAYIKEVWTDMRPLSLRKKMEAPRE